MSLKVNDPTDRGLGGRQYGTAEDIETLKGKNDASRFLLGWHWRAPWRYPK